MSGQTSTTIEGAAPVAPAAPRYRVRMVSFAVVREPGQPPRPTLSAPAEVARVAQAIIPDDAREHFGVFLLNAQNRLVAYHEVSVGTLSASLVHPREVFAPALRVPGIASVVLIHNHPSGDPTPSHEDIRLTRQLVDAGRLLDITVHDHVVIGNETGQFVSFAERGLLT